MARPGVTYEDVRKACEELEAANTPPTINRIKDKLGSGSPNNIGAHLKRWKDAEQPRKISERPLAENIATAITNEIQKTVDQETEQLTRQLEETTQERDSAQAQCKDLAADRKRLLEQIDTLSDSIQQLTAKLDEKDTLISTVKEERDRTSSEAKTAIEELTLQIEDHRCVAEKARIELAEINVENQSLKGQVERMPAIEKAREEAEKKAEVSRAREHSATSNFNKLEQDIASLKSRLDERNMAINQLQQQLSETKAEWSDLRVENAILKERERSKGNTSSGAGDKK